MNKSKIKKKEQRRLNIKGKDKMKIDKNLERDKVSINNIKIIYNNSDFSNDKILEDKFWQEPIKEVYNLDANIDLNNIINKITLNNPKPAFNIFSNSIKKKKKKKKIILLLKTKKKIPKMK